MIASEVDWAPSPLDPPLVFQNTDKLIYALSTQHIGIMTLVPSDGIICEPVCVYLIYCLIYCNLYVLPQKLAFLGQYFSAIHFWSDLVTLLKTCEICSISASSSSLCSSYKTASRPSFFVNTQMYSSRNKLLQVVNVKWGRPNVVQMVEL